MKALCFVNLSANAGRAQAKWKRLKPLLLKEISDLEIIEYRGKYDFNLSIYIKDGIHFFISAGGDGTHHYFLQELLRCNDLEKIFWGAVGLGSSNDFLKPNAKLIGGIPCCLNLKNSFLADVGIVKWSEKNQEEKQEYFSINASLGLTSFGNYLFNQGDFVINFFKRKNIDLAILYTTLKALFTHKSQKIKIKMEGFENDILLSNLNIVKIPHVSGSFYYKNSVTRNDGLLGVYLSHSTSIFGLLRLLYLTTKGEFTDSAKKIKSFVRTVSVKSTECFIFEIDGETYLANDASFSIASKKINCLGP